MRKWMHLAAVMAMAATSAMAQDETIYASPTPVPAEEGVNQGGINFRLELGYLTDYIYRGVDYSEVVSGSEDSPNIHADSQIDFDLGERAPHPYLAASANVYDSDPESRFQEFRTEVGASLNLQPVTFTGAVVAYTYPERDAQQTSEVDFKVQLDDSRLLGSERPVFNPYLLTVYDYDQNNGWYIEAGVRHDFELEDLSLTISPIVRVAYTSGWQQQFVFEVEDGTGWQHVDAGLQVQYQLNALLNLSRRWGEWFLRGEVFYTEHLSDRTVGHTENWGGLAIGFSY